MTVTLYSSSPCMICGYLIKVLMMATVRINRRSMRTTGPMLGSYAYSRCPECGTDNRTGASCTPRAPYQLAPEDAARVEEYRARRWGVAA